MAGAMVHLGRGASVMIILMMVVVAEAARTPPGIANNPSHATCKNVQYKDCYNLVHVCPKFCPDSCHVECASCKPICGPGSDGETTTTTSGDNGSNGEPKKGKDDKGMPNKDDKGTPNKDDKGTPNKDDKGKPDKDKPSPPIVYPSPPPSVPRTPTPPPVVYPSPPPSVPSTPTPPPIVYPSPPPFVPSTPTPPISPTPPSVPTPTPPVSPTPPSVPTLTPPVSPTPPSVPTPTPPVSPTPPSEPTPSPPVSPTPPSVPTPTPPVSPTPPSEPTPSPPVSPTPPSRPTPPPPVSPTPPSTPTPPTPPSSDVSPKKAKCRDPEYTHCYNMEHYCPKSCPGGCEVDCVTCKPVCSCDKPGHVCQDPRFIGGDGITFYFHGKKNRDFCLLSDSNLHINAHFIGKRNQNMKRDFTWVQAIGILFDHHQIYIGAQKTATWDDSVDRLALSFDGQPIYLPESEGAKWQSEIAPSVTISRSSVTNAITVEVEGNFKITANVVPITEEESRVHNYGITKDDCFAHLDLGFKFYSLSEDVNGVLGQTYGKDYVSKVKMGVSMPVMGGDKKFVTSSVFANDCAVARFTGSGASSEMAEYASLTCASGMDGRGVVCKR
ncbi:Root cap [Macleaya cordata]|uniref:Root cap n=1 Tax=Macleaya cordata TaxID=56857 RepID=A0A200Q6B9_MACCD|nr:Root cap [Macleaya cordata]